MNIPDNEKLIKIIELFWHTVPPVWHASRSMTHKIIAEEFHITPLKFHVLRRISEGKLSVSQLADCLCLSRPNVSRTVDELTNEGLIVHSPNPADRRGVKIELTAKGLRLFKIMHQRIIDEMINFFSRLSNKELKTLTSGLLIIEKLLDNSEE